jgi:hypothetical protein
MRNVGRKLAFVLASSNHGTMIINRFDYRMTGPDAGIGVGFQLLEAGAFDSVEVELAVQTDRNTPARSWRRRSGDRLRRQYRRPHNRMGDRDDRLGLEGMELEALEGARETIKRSHPIILVESIKAGRELLRAFLDERGYKVVEAGVNLLAIHKNDPVVNELQVPELPAQSSAA